jgi:hypothetical protein
MAKFEKGYIYIIRTYSGFWYLVRQVGMKSWVAYNFANLNMDRADILYRSNAVDLWKKLKPIVFRKVGDFDANKAEYRKLMFQVLQHGTFEEK